MNLALRRAKELSFKAPKSKMDHGPVKWPSRTKPGCANPENWGSGFAHLQVLGGVLGASLSKWPFTSASFHLPRVLQDQSGFQAQPDQRVKG